MPLSDSNYQLTSIVNSCTTQSITQGWLKVVVVYHRDTAIVQLTDACSFDPFSLASTSTVGAWKMNSYKSFSKPESPE